MYLEFFPVSTACTVMPFNSLFRMASLPPFLPPTHQPQSCFKNVGCTFLCPAWMLEWLAMTFKFNPNHRMWLEWPFMVFYHLISYPSPLVQVFQHTSPFSWIFPFLKKIFLFNYYYFFLAMIVLCLGPLLFVFHILSLNVREASHDCLNWSSFPQYPQS